jgi:hypothetical protein
MLSHITDAVRHWAQDDAMHHGDLDGAVPAAHPGPA